MGKLQRGVRVTSERWKCSVVWVEHSEHREGTEGTQEREVAVAVEVGGKAAGHF